MLDRGTQKPSDKRLWMKPGEIVRVTKENVSSIEITAATPTTLTRDGIFV